MAKQKPPTGRHLGFTIPAFAKALGETESKIRRAVDKGQIETIPFAGLRRIPPRELTRIRTMFGDVKAVLEAAEEARWAADEAAGDVERHPTKVREAVNDADDEQVMT